MYVNVNVTVCIYTAHPYFSFLNDKKQKKGLPLLKKVGSIMF